MLPKMAGVVRHFARIKLIRVLPFAGVLHSYFKVNEYSTQGQKFSLIASHTHGSTFSMLEPSVSI